MIVRLFLALSVLLSLIPNNLAEATSAASGIAQCGSPSSIRATCYAKVLSARPAISPVGYSPSQLRSAYRASGIGNAHIAVVDAYGDPGIKADLDTYSRNFGLPILPTCIRAAQAGCFEVTDQSGGQNLPRANQGWALETALDVETVHGMCPGCRIQLVQAKSASMVNLIAAVDRAVQSGAQIVSMSWGGSETPSEISADSHFASTNVDFVASSGDSGYGTSWPAVSPRVVAVGGTRLNLNSAGARLSETAWSGSGSGCSKFEAKPAWQHDPACSHRTVADISAVADPATGAAVYSSLSSGGSGWFSVGGTSLAAPIIAGLIGLSGGSSQAELMSKLYGSLGTASIFDITSGANGGCSNYLCQALRGYDGPTGTGAPIGLSAL